jgi:hypothetical protein
MSESTTPTPRESTSKNKNVITSDGVTNILETLESDEKNKTDDSSQSKGKSSAVVKGLNVYCNMMFGMTSILYTVGLGIKTFGSTDHCDIFFNSLSIIWMICVISAVIGSIAYLVHAYCELSESNKQLQDKKSRSLSLLCIILPTVVSILGLLLVGIKVFDQARMFNGLDFNRLSYATDLFKPIGIGCWSVAGFLFFAMLCLAYKKYKVRKKAQSKQEQQLNEDNLPKLLSLEATVTFLAAAVCFASIGSLLFFNENTCLRLSADIIGKLNQGMFWGSVGIASFALMALVSLAFVCWLCDVKKPKRSRSLIMNVSFAAIFLSSAYISLYYLSPNISMNTALTIGFLSIGLGIFVRDLSHTCYSRYLRTGAHWNSQINGGKEYKSVNRTVLILSGLGVGSFVITIALSYFSSLDSSYLPYVNFSLFTFGVTMISLSLIVKTIYPENNAEKYENAVVDASDADQYIKSNITSPSASQTKLM